MNAEDLQSPDNNRQDAIDKLIVFCTENDLSYSYNAQIFGVKLPDSEPRPNATQMTPPSRKRAKFDISNWGPKTYVEGEEPDPEQPLTEGEPPKEQL